MFPGSFFRVPHAIRRARPRPRWRLRATTSPSTIFPITSGHQGILKETPRAQRPKHVENWLWKVEWNGCSPCVSKSKRIQTGTLTKGVDRDQSNVWQLQIINANLQVKQKTWSRTLSSIFWKIELVAKSTRLDHSPQLLMRNVYQCLTLPFLSICSCSISHTSSQSNPENPNDSFYLQVHYGSWRLKRVIRPSGKVNNPAVQCIRCKARKTCNVCPLVLGWFIIPYHYKLNLYIIATNHSFWSSKPAKLHLFTYDSMYIYIYYIIHI